MAFLWKHPESKYWMARFRDIHGKARNRSTKVIAEEKNRKQAQKIADAFEAVAVKKRTLAHTRKVIAQLHEEITGESAATVTMRAFVESWLATKKAEVKTGTFLIYERVTREWLEFLGDKSEYDINDITRNDVLGFRNARVAKVSAISVNNGMAVIRALFTSAREDGYIADNPGEFVKPVKESKGVEEVKRRAFTVLELKRVLEFCDEEWRSMVLCALYSGQRLADIATLTWGQVDLGKGVIDLTTRKTGKKLRLPIPPPLRAHLKSIRPKGNKPPSEPLHPRSFEIVKRRGNAGTLSNQFAANLRRAGFRTRRAKTDTGGRRRLELSFHSIRATATTMLHDAGVPTLVSQALIGHDSEAVHKDYYKVGDKALREAAAKLPDIR